MGLKFDVSKKITPTFRLYMCVVRASVLSGHDKNNSPKTVVAIGSIYVLGSYTATPASHKWLGNVPIEILV